jgi:ATP-binding cassette subfamily F protein 3
MVISHDRYFLDHTVEKILELSNGKGELYTGNYSRFIGEREKRRQMRQKEYEEQQELIARTEEFIRRNIAGQNTRQAQSRQKMLDRLERLEKVRTGGASARFRFDLKTQSGHLVLETRNLAVGYDGIALAGLLNLKVYRGERVGIIGPNGSGKTTLLRTLLSELPPVRGEYEFGFKVDLAFYAQQLTLLNPELTVLEEMREITPLSTEEELRSYLARFLFRGEEVFKAVGTLSGGEKSRLALARLIFGKANTLILDEPTNHLDIPSREALEDALLSFPGTLLMVSHDRYLINKLAQRIVYFDGEGNVTVQEGNYDEFEAQRAVSPARESQPVKPVEPLRLPEIAADSSPRRLSKNERNKTLQRCSQLENEIEALEEELHSITAALNDPAYSSDYQRLQDLGNQFETSTSRRNQLYTEWEQLQTTLAEE